MAPHAQVDAELFGSLFVLVQHLGRRADEELAGLGLTGRQWLLLAVVQKAFPDAPPTLSEAAAVYGSSRQNVKQIAVQLADRGWLRLVPDAADGRATRLVLTRRITEFADPATVELQRAFLAEVFSPLTTAERRTLRDLVVRCVAHLSQPPVVVARGGTS
jgi:DNA-binding MarR family transcriptional regulator